VVVVVVLPTAAVASEMVGVVLSVDVVSVAVVGTAEVLAGTDSLDESPPALQLAIMPHIPMTKMERRRMMTTSFQTGDASLSVR
jgi:hypothetical protein